MRGRRRKLLGLASGLLLVLVGIVVVGWLTDDAHEPRFQGQSWRYWFPQWSYELAFDTSTQLQRSKILAGAGPEAVPMLASAARAHDSPLALRYATLRRGLPSYLSHWVLPVYREGATVRYGVERVLRSMCAREDTLVAITNHWDLFPDAAKSEVLGWLAESTELPRIAEPLLLRVLRSTNHVLGVEAAVALCQYPSVAALHFDEMAPRLAELPPERLEASAPALGAELTTILVELGPAASAAEPMLEGWLRSPSPRLRAFAAIALPAVAPTRFDLAGTVDANVLRTGASLADALAVDRVRRTRRLLRWAELVPVLSPVLRSATARAADPSGVEERTHAILWFLRELGPEASGALADVVPLLSREDFAHSAAQVIARMGPTAPESIPSLLPALTNLTTAMPLVLLMAAYGPQAREALPALELLAAGSAELAERQFRAEQCPDVPGRERSQIVYSRELHVPAALAGTLGLSYVWPSPAELGASPGLVWAEDQFEVRSGNAKRLAPTAPGTIRMPMASFDQIARHALRRVRGDTP